MRTFLFEAVLLMGALWTLEGEGHCRVPNPRAGVAECRGVFTMAREGWLLEFGAFRMEGEDVHFLEPVRLQSEEGNVQAEGGLWRGQTLTLEKARGNWNRWTFQAERLLWDGAQLRLFGHVVCRGADTEVRGQRVSLRGTRLTVEGGAEIRWQDAELRARRIEGENQDWRLRGPLTGRWSGATSLFFSAEEALLQGDTLLLRQAYLAWKDGEARADRVRIQWEESSATLEGRAAGSLRGKRFQAEKVIWNWERSSLSLRGAVRVWFPRSVFRQENP